MKEIAKQQEVFIVATTNYLQRQICEKGPNGKPGRSNKVYFENAFWFGLFNEILPEIFDSENSDKCLYKMYMHQSLRSFQFGLSESFTLKKLPPYEGTRVSIDPCIFLPVTNYN
jgi:hypothetical protein